MDRKLKKIFNAISLEKKEKFSKEITFNFNNVYIDEKEYANSFRELYQDIKRISYKKFEEEINSYIAKKLSGQQDVIEQENGFKEYIEKKYPLKKFRIFNNINNVIISDKLDCGIYKLYNLEKNKSALEKSILETYNEGVEENKKRDRVNEEFWGENIFVNVIETNVEARDFSFATKLANEENNKFLDILSFVLFFEPKLYNKFIISIGPISNYLITNIRGATNGHFYYYENYHLDKKFIKNLDEIKEFDLFNLLLNLNSNRTSEYLFNKILKSLKWFREALEEEDNANSLLKGMICLESLLSFQEESFMAPSISHGIAENVSIILGKTLEERFDIYKNVKNLYGKRSAITHTGKKEIDYNDKFQLCNILAWVIRNLLEDSKYKSIVNNVSYIEYFRKIKFSSI